MEWSLRSSDPDFESCEHLIFDGDFVDGGATWSSHDLFHVPNTLGVTSRRKLIELIESPPPLEVYDTTFNGKLDGYPASVQVTVSIESDTPPSVSWENYQYLVRSGCEDMILPYQGNGLFQLQKPQ